MRIAIIGAGISGLATAGALCRAGFDTQVFEGAASVRAGGSGITLFANALTALDSLGYGEPIRALQARQPSVLGGQRTHTGRLLAKLPADLASQSLAVSRQELHRILLGGIPEPRVHTGHRLTSASTTGELEFSTGASDEPVHKRFDVVIGADGIRSTVRAAIGLVRAPALLAIRRGAVSPRRRWTWLGWRASRGACARGLGTPHLPTAARIGLLSVPRKLRMKIQVRAHVLSRLILIPR